MALGRKASDGESDRANGAAATWGYTMIDLLVGIALLAVLTVIVLPAVLPQPRARARSSRINCTCNLKQVNLAFLQSALDHNDRLPMQFLGTNGVTHPAFEYFLVMSNELPTPKVLLCPADKVRVDRKGQQRFWSTVANSNISYFVGLEAVQTNGQMLLTGDRNITNGLRLKGGVLELSTNQLAGWTEDLHGLAGNIGLADGSVQQLTRTRLREQIEYSGVATNRLAMP